MNFKEQEKELDKLIDLLGIDYYEDKNFVLCNGKVRQDGNFYTYEEAIESLKASNCNRIGLWIPKGFLVLDTDTKEASKIVGNYVKDKEIKTPVIKTAKGYHFYFRYDGDMTQIVKGTINLGCEVDYRVANKGYVVLPINDKDRVIKQLEEIEYITHKLLPVEEIKSKTIKKTDVKNKVGRPKESLSSIPALKDGDGRDALIIKMLGKASVVPSMRDEESLFIIAKAINSMFEDQYDEDYLMKKVDTMMKRVAPVYINSKGKIIDSALSKHLLTNEPVFYNNGGYFYYENGVYKIQTKNSIKRLIKKYIDNEENQSISLLNNVLEHIAIDSEEENIKLDDNIVNLRNCLLNIDTNEVIQHSKEFKTVNQLNCNYDPNITDEDIKNSRFYKFLLDSLSNDVNVMEYLQNYCGTVLNPKPHKLQFALWLIGSGSNGKSLFCSILQDVIGEENCSVVKSGELSDMTKSYSLVNSILNIPDDDDLTNLKETGNYKSAVSGKKVRVKALYNDPIDITPRTLFIFPSNKAPISMDKTHGFGRRNKTIPFNKIFGSEEDVRNKKAQGIADNTLEDYIKEHEKDIVFAWLLQGYKRVVASNWKITEPKAVTKASKKNEYLNNPALEFVETELERNNLNEEEDNINKTSYITSKELYDIFTEWCRENQIDSVPSQRTLGEQMRTCGYESKRDWIKGKKITIYKNVQLQEECPF